MTTAHVSRMLVERYELMQKIIKLKAFIESNPIYVALDPDEQHDMGMQCMRMEQYCELLERRIRRAEQQAPKLADDMPTRNPQTMPPPDVPGGGLPLEPSDDFITSTQEIASALTPSPATAEPIASFESGRGGDYAGAGASGSWDSGSSSSDSGSSSSSDSGSSSSGSD